MMPKTVLDKLSIYIPQGKMEQKPVERLMKLGVVDRFRTPSRPILAPHARP